MPVSKVRKKSKGKKKGPTPKKDPSIREMKRMLEFLEKAEQEYANQQNNDEENHDGSER